MKKYIRIGCLVCLPFLTIAQGNLVNDGVNLVINNGITIQVEGEVKNDNNGSITNNGDIYLDEDWSQAGATTTYEGAGWINFEGSANQNISSVSPFTIENISVDNGNLVVLNSPLSVVSLIDLKNNGSIQLGTNNLTLGNNAMVNGFDNSNYIITNNTGTVNQEIGSSATFLPIGNSSYNPAMLTNTGTADVFSIRVEDQMLEEGISGTAFTEGIVERTWLIDEAVAGGSNLNLELNWQTSQELSNFDRSVAGVVHYTGGIWNKSYGFSPGVLVSGTQYNVSATGITSFSPFGVATQNANLPIELLSFDAQRQSSNAVLLNWVTSTETNNQGFEVERMLDFETEFQKVSWVDGQGTTIQRTSYAYSDKNEHPGISYYHLNQLDFDGTSGYSEIRAVHGELSSEIILFPNPATSEVSILIKNLQEGQVNLSLLNSIGQEVRQFSQTVIAKQLIRIGGMDDLPSGNYLFNIRQENGDVFTKKFILRNQN